MFAMTATKPAAKPATKPAAPRVQAVPMDIAARLLDRGLGAYMRRELAKALGGGMITIVDADGDFVCHI